MIRALTKHKDVIELSIILLLIAALAITFVDKSFSSITGFVSKEVKSQNVHITVDSSKEFSITDIDNKPITITAFQMSGVVKGAGTVFIFLKKGERQYLVHTNTKKAGSGGMSAITGMAVKSDEEKTSGEMVIAMDKEADEFVKLPEGFVAMPGAFDNACIETCILQGKAEDTKLRVLVEPGTKVIIKEIIYTVASE